MGELVSGALQLLVSVFIAVALWMLAVRLAR